MARKNNLALRRMEARYKNGLARSRSRMARTKQDGMKKAARVGAAGAIGGVGGYGLGEYIEVQDWQPMGIDGRYMIGLPAAIGGIGFLFAGWLALGIFSVALAGGLFGSLALRSPLGRAGDARWKRYDQAEGTGQPQLADKDVFDVEFSDEEDEEFAMVEDYGEEDEDESDIEF